MQTKLLKPSPERQVKSSMSTVVLRKTKRGRRKIRVRKKVVGTPERPRLSVYRSNKYCYGQIIDDTSGKTLVGISLNEVRKLHEDKKKKSEAAFEVGKKLAEVAKSKKIKGVVFDRNGYSYHGRVKQIAEGAREGGLKL